MPVFPNTICGSLGPCSSAARAVLPDWSLCCRWAVCCVGLSRGGAPGRATTAQGLLPVQGHLRQEEERIPVSPPPLLHACSAPLCPLCAV